MPKLGKNAPKTAKAARVKSELHKFKTGTMHSGSKTGPKVTNRKQAIAIALSESGQSKKKKSNGSNEDALLKRHGHHLAMARKHNAHADLIEAKLKLQGKRIDRYGDSPTESKKVKPRIVPA